MGAQRDEGLVEEMRRRLLERFLAEREHGGVPSLAACQEEFPDFADLVREEYARCIAEEEGSAGHEDGLATLGHFRLIRELGRGGNGVVHLAEDTRRGQMVALKMLRGLGAWSPSLRERLRREADAAQRLDHPGICKVFEVGEIDGTPFLAMEYVEGRRLADIVADARESPPGRGDLEALELVEEVSRAVHTAHEAGLLHRDVNPANIMVRSTGDPVLLDFGLARLEGDAEHRLTQTGDVLGTPAYLAPEQIAAPGAEIGVAADVYGLGVTLYECLTRQRPFDAPTREQLYQQILRHRAPDPRRRNPEISKGVASILEVALDKSPHRRYASALALAEDLERARRGQPTLAKPPGPLRRCAAWVRQRPAVAAVLLVLALVLPVLGWLGAERIATAERLAAVEREERRQEIEALTCEGFVELERGAVTEGRRLLRLALARAEVPPVETIAGLALPQDCDHAALLLALDRCGDAPEATMVRAWILRRLGRAAEAAALKASHPAPKTALAYFLLGMWAMRRGYHGDHDAYPDALAQFKRAIFYSDRPRLLHYQELAHAAGHLADRKTAIECADVLTTRWPESSTSWSRAGFALEHIDGDRAITAYETALRIRPRMLQAALGLGRLLLRRGRISEAVDLFEHSLQIDERSAEATLGLGRAMEKRGSFAEALTLFEKSLRLRPGFGEARECLIATLSVQGNCRRAVEMGEAWVKEHPGEIGAHHALGLALLHAGSISEARRCFEEAIRLQPTNPAAHNSLGNVLAQSGLLREAAEEFETAIHYGPGLGEAYYNLGNTMLQQGKCDAAIVALETALAIEPSNGMTKRTLGGALHREGRLLEALAALRGAAASSPDGLSEALRHEIATCEIKLARVARRDAKEAAEIEESASIRAPEARRLRASVHRALEAVVASWQEDHGGDGDSVASESTRRKRLLGAPAFARLRDADFLSRLDPQERESWRRLWANAEGIRADH